MLSRQMPCPACGPHEHHTPMRCEVDGCLCAVVPVPGIDLEET